MKGPVIKIDKPPKHWWSGDQRVEKYMPKIDSALDRSGLKGQKRIDVYNRAYEAIYQVMQDVLDHCAEIIVATPQPEKGEKVEQILKALSGKGSFGDTGILTVNILRNWTRDWIERFATHLLGNTTADAPQEKCPDCGGSKLVGVDFNENSASFKNCPKCNGTSPKD